MGETESGLSEREEKQLKELRRREELENYKSKIESELNGVSPAALDVTDTQLDSFNDRSIERRFQWIKTASQEREDKYPNSNLLVNRGNGTVHLLKKHSTSRTDGITSLCGHMDFEFHGDSLKRTGYRSAGRNKLGTHPNLESVTTIQLSRDRICGACLGKKKRLVAAKSAIRRANSE